MKLAASSLAWKPSEDEAVAAALLRHGFSGVELAPTKVWPRLEGATEGAVRDYRQRWNDRGIQVVALQALLFGRDDLTLFGSRARRAEDSAWFEHLFQIAHWLGARALVYGSPKNRRGVDPKDPAVQAEAVEYFQRLGAAAARHGVCLCIEPLPRSYPCDFVNDVGEALALVDRVGERGFGLHVDASSLHIGERDPRAALEAARGRIEHFHLSEPGLAPVRLAGPTPLVESLRLLKGLGYPNWVSIEMLEPSPVGGNLATLEECLREVRQAWDTA